MYVLQLNTLQYYHIYFSQTYSFEMFEKIKMVYYCYNYSSIHMFFKYIEKYWTLLTLCPSKYLKLKWQRKESTRQIQFSSKSGKSGYSTDLVSAQTAVRTSPEKRISYDGNGVSKGVNTFDTSNVLYPLYLLVHFHHHWMIVLWWS